MSQNAIKCGKRVKPRFRESKIEVTTSDFQGLEIVMEKVILKLDLRFGLVNNGDG